jgi:uncharacterized membrane protein YgdD (TMEM256/DUF423 family)
MRPFLTLAALSGFLAIAFGAFAAHGASGQAAELLRTGAQYQASHALAVFACAFVAPQRRLAPSLFLTGTALFSGSLYALAFGAPRLVGIITPFGGLCFLAGWLVLAWTSWRKA